MRVIPIALQTHLGLSTRTMTTLVKVTRTDGVVLYAASLNRPVTFEGNVYQALGFLRTDLTAEDEMSIGTTNVEGILDSATITEDDVRAGRWDAAAWEMRRINYVTPTDGAVYLGSGQLGSCTIGRLRWTAELLGLMQSVQNSLGNLNSPLCVHNFGKSEGGPGLGNGCTVDVAGSPSFTQSGTASSMDSDFYGVHDGARTEPDGYYSNGIFRVTTGVMAGMEFEIRGYIVGFWILFTALPYDVTGEDYEIVRGCDKSLRTCIDVFDNLLDRLASDYTQGGDAAMQTARHNG